MFVFRFYTFFKSGFINIYDFFLNTILLEFFYQTYL